MSNGEDQGPAPLTAPPTVTNEAIGATSPEISPLATEQPEEPVKQAPCYLPSVGKEPLRQSEILSSVVQHRVALESLGNIDEISIDPLVFSLAIIMSQDCDLKQDHDERGAAQNNLDESSNNRILPNVLLCPVVTDSELFGALPRGSDIKKRVVQNKDERYQYLRSVAPEEDARGKGLSALGIDFRRYFTVPTAELYAQLSNRTERRCRLNATYLEHLSSRFNAYLSRVALPRNHHEE